MGSEETKGLHATGTTKTLGDETRGRRQEKAETFHLAAPGEGLHQFPSWWKTDINLRVILLLVNCVCVPSKKLWVQVFLISAFLFSFLLSFFP